MRPVQQPTNRNRNRDRCIRLLLDGPLDDIGKARRCVLGLSIEVFSRACGLSRLSLELGLGIASHPADAFLDFAADVLSGAGYPIFVHDDLPICRP
jgi:hypothetical protein